MQIAKVQMRQITNECTEYRSDKHIFEFSNINFVFLFCAIRVIVISFEMSFHIKQEGQEALNRSSEYTGQKSNI